MVDAVMRSFKIIFTICILVSVVAGVYAAIVDDSDPAPAKSREVISERIDVQLADDGTLHVTDARTYRFNGSFTLVGEILDPSPTGAYKVNGVSVVDANGTETQLELVEFEESWRRAGGAGDGHYALDEKEDSIYAFTDSSDEEKTIVFDYEYTDMADVYKDCGILYWQFVPRGRGEQAADVQATLTLPVPAGESIEAAQNVFAWGHCELGGDVSFGGDGTIVFSVPRTEPGVFAEMRVAFPPSWVANASEDVVHGYDELDSVKAQEQAWADETAAEIARQQRTEHMADTFVALLFIVSIIIVIAAFALFMRYGREHRPQFAEQYWRDVPDRDADPALVARIWRWNKHDNDDISTMLLHLENKGLVQLVPETVTTKRLFGPKERKTHRVVRLKGEGIARSDMDDATLSLVFDRIGGGRSSLTLDTIEQLGKDRPSTFRGHIERWQATLDRQVERKDYFERTSRRLRSGMKSAGIAIIILGLLAFPSGLMLDAMFGLNLEIGYYIKPFICLLPGALALLGISPFMERRSQEAVDIYARSKALKRWLHDFTALDEALPADAKVWGELLVYASMFGIADRVLNQLRIRMPELFDGDALSGAAGSGAQTLGTIDRNVILATGAFSASVGAALHAARNELAKDSVRDAFTTLFSSSGGGGGGGSSWSSGGGGGGGGFSSGGGGGHSSGGGSFAR